MQHRSASGRTCKAHVPDPLSEKDKDKLAASLYGSTPSFVAGVVAAVLFSAYGWTHTDAYGVRTCCAALATSAVARLVVFCAYHVRQRAGEPNRTVWTRVYLGGAVAYAISAGCLAGAVFDGATQSESVRLLAVIYATGYSACVAGRNAGWPIVSQAQVLGCNLPLVAGILGWGRGDDYLVLLFSLLLTLASLDTAKGGNLLLRDAFAARRKQERDATLLNVAVSNMSHALVMVGEDGRILISNARLAFMLGLDAGQRNKGMDARSFYMRRVAPKLRDPSSARDLWAAAVNIAHGGEDASLDLSLADGRTLQVWLTNTGSGIVAIADDVTAARAAHARTERLAYHDAVTDLPNRRMFLARFAELTAGGRAGALLCIDLDRFKQVNDTLGHPMGDRLLGEVAARLSAVATAEDVVSRFGGDEFAILQAGAGRGAAEILADKVVRTLCLPFYIDGTRVDIGGSVGVALVPTHAADAQGALAAADVALYASKAAGRGTWRVFDTGFPVGAGRDRRGCANGSMAA